VELRLKGIGKKFRDEWVLKDIELNLLGGEVVLLLGQNSAGKTTLLKILATLLKPSRGSYMVDSIDVVKHPEKIRNRIILIPEDPPVIPELSVEENLEFYSKVFGFNGSFEALMRHFGIINNKRVKELSKGMKQRLVLAISQMVKNPIMLLMDEPTNELDAETVEMVKEIVRDMANTGILVVIASHDEDLISVATRVVILENGEKIFDERIDEVMRRRMVEVEVDGERKTILASELKNMEDYRLVRVLGVREGIIMGGDYHRDRIQA
jgi:ABC-2 type transport system ATP-binding protein